VNSLLIISQLARVGADNYEIIKREEIMEDLGRLLRHPDDGVRSKCCNLIGNLCRHDASFYDDLKRTIRVGKDTTSILTQLIDRCIDSDSKTRKFACFAVGNAAFHSAALYDQLRTAIPYLVQALRDSDDKTRANAAGALGNLVRNDGNLAEELVFHKVGKELLAVAREDKMENPRRISLFSLGTLAVYSLCRREIVAGGVQDAMSELKDGCKDEVTVKYLDRLQNKLSARCIG
jgi:fused-like protein